MFVNGGLTSCPKLCYTIPGFGNQPSLIRYKEEVSKMQDWQIKLREVSGELVGVKVKVEPVAVKKQHRLGAVSCYKDSKGLHLDYRERR